MSRLLATLTMFSLLFAATVTAEATPRQKTRTEYIVTETHPFTGGTVSRTRYADRQSADRQYAQRSQAHWVKWRFVGINEPLRFERFSSSFAAQDFIDDGGPASRGKFGFAILTNETRNVRTKVTLTTVTAPVTGGGNGGGGSNGGPDVVDVIDRIIGIIDR